MKVETAQFAQSSSIHAPSKRYAVDRKWIREWIQYLKAGKFNGVNSTAARLPGGGRHVISEEDNDEKYWESDVSNAMDQEYPGHHWGWVHHIEQPAQRPNFRTVWVISDNYAISAIKPVLLPRVWYCFTENSIIKAQYKLILALFDPNGPHLAPNLCLLTCSRFCCNKISINRPPPPPPLMAWGGCILINAPGVY